MNSEIRRLRPPTMDELAARAKFATLEDVMASIFADMKPSNRMSVTEASETFTRVSNGPGSTKPWSANITPYLRQPQDVMTSLDFTGMIFVGPARTGKTLMGLSWISHTVKTDPADMLYVHMDRENARKWSNGDLQRFLMASTAVRAEQITARQHDNTFDKAFRSGMRFLLTYPTASNLSGITVGRVMLIDYDRMDDDVDGEGNPYDLASMRTTTFKRLAMTVAESSPNPNKEIADPRWIPETPHAAPPIKGIFELYNRGDRRRWFWCCPQCDEWFEPSFSRLDWSGKTDPMEARDAARMICPHGCIISPRHKDTLNRNGRWVREGEMIPAGADSQPVCIPGQRVTRSSIASFWLKGPAAAYQDWGALVEKYLRAEKALEETGDDGPLRKTITTDQGEFYIPRSRLSDLAPEVLKNNSEDWGSTPENPTVPHGVRFLVATVDVQKSAFVVQVIGYTATGDRVIIEPFKVRLSNRRNTRDERLPIDPAAFGEDWHTLIEEVMDRTYELADGSGRRMRIRATACDSGGAEGVTGHAYNFWRHLKSIGRHTRFMLVKGIGTNLSRPEAKTERPDSSQRDRMAVARGDVPVVMLNSNKLKDRVHLLMQRTVDENSSDGGRLRYPDWVENWFFTQLTSEIREGNGKWTNTRKRRNETFDLTCYGEAVVIRPVEMHEPFVHFGYDRMRFDGTEPIWARDWDQNELVFGGADDQQIIAKPKVSLADLAKSLA